MKQYLKDKRIQVGLVIFLLNFVYLIGFSVPKDFPTNTLVEIKSGTNLSQIAQELEDTKVIRSSVTFGVITKIFGGERRIQAGDYYLHDRESSLTLAWRFVLGRHDLEVARVTIREGEEMDEILKYFDERFSRFDKEEFAQIARVGYIFPDTYFLPINITAKQAVEVFENNYKRQTAVFKDVIDESEFTEEEIIILASIIEAEVPDLEDKKLVSGVLLERLSIDMPLQVDPAPETYKERGLPKKPINNPGLESIEAALNPTITEYLYFMSGKDGKTYYAETLEDHIINIQKHL